MRELTTAEVVDWLQENVECSDTKIPYSSLAYVIGRGIAGELSDCLADYMALSWMDLEDWEAIGITRCRAACIEMLEAQKAYKRGEWRP